MSQHNHAVVILKNRIESLLSFLAPAAGWLPILAFLLYSVKIRIYGNYFNAILISSGQANAKTFNNALFLFRQDLLWFGLLTPIGFAMVFHFARPKLVRVFAWIFVLTLSLLASLLLYANLQSWGQVGRFISSSALLDAASFAISKPDIATSYISVKGLIKLVVLLLGSTLLYAAAKQQKMKFLTGAMVGIGLIASLLGAAVGYQTGLRETRISASFLINAIRSLMPETEIDQGLNKLSDVELLQRYRDLSLIGNPDAKSPNFGAERHSNLILFVLETASVEFLDTRMSLPVHPVWDMLSPNRYVSGNHYSSFPASAESNLSILTGMYPPRAYYDTCLVDLPGFGEIPGLMSQLKAQGIMTAAYLPYSSQVPMDKVAFEANGFRKVFYGSKYPDPSIGNADLVALHQLNLDIKAWSDAKQRFAVGFYPQHGHGPWNVANGRTIAARGHRVVMQQLDWLQQIVETLKKAGTLDDTVILVTGDHGVRTTEEDPNLKTGMVDRYSFHVPLILFAPHSQYPQQISMQPTSHVDVPAEISHLFGLPQPKIYQGLPLLHPSLAQRRQFFMAGWYFGSNGYRQSSHAAMYSNVLGLAFARPDSELTFTPDTLVVDKIKEESIKTTIAGILDIQSEWVRRFACQGKHL